MVEWLFYSARRVAGSTNKSTRINFTPTSALIDINRSSARVQCARSWIFEIRNSNLESGISKKSKSKKKNRGCRLNPNPNPNADASLRSRFEEKGEILYVSDWRLLSVNQCCFTLVYNDADSAGNINMRNNYNSNKLLVWLARVQLSRVVGGRQVTTANQGPKWKSNWAQASQSKARS